MQRLTRRFLVTGTVQGVYFRQSTRRVAERLTIGGIARNLSDGSVEVIAHGAAEALTQLHEWLHQGPPLARVDRVVQVDPLPEHVAGGQDDATASVFHTE